MDTRACQQRIPLSTDGTDRCVKTYADNLDAICILFMFFLLRNPIWMEKTDGHKTSCYLFTGSISPIREAYVLLPS